MAENLSSMSEAVGSSHRITEKGWGERGMARGREKRELKLNKY